MRLAQPPHRMERDLVKEQGTVNLACVASLFLLLMIDAEMGLTFSLHFIFFAELSLQATINRLVAREPGHQARTTSADTTPTTMGSSRTRRAPSISQMVMALHLGGSLGRGASPAPRPRDVCLTCSQVMAICDLTWASGTTRSVESTVHTPDISSGHE